MKKISLTILLFSLCLSCESKKEIEHLFNEYVASINTDLSPIGTYFWSEFGGLESQYGLTKNESKLLGEWNEMSLDGEPWYNHYTFFPNNLFILRFRFENFRIVAAKEMYFNKALGTWEIIDGIVKITIYAIVTIDREKTHPYNKDVFYVELPYTFDFINIDDIDERGFTKRPINDTILSKELQQRVTIKEPNRTNNLYVRNVYTMDVIPKLEKNYGYFHYFPEMAKENHSGIDIVMNPELIKKYIPDWMY